jgi:hypothetical protein
MSREDFGLLVFGLFVLSIPLCLFVTAKVSEYIDEQRAPRNRIVRFYNKKLSKYFSDRRMHSICGDVQYDFQRYGHRAKYIRRIGKTFTELSQISKNGKLTSYIFELSCDSASCLIEFFPNHMRGEVLCVDDKEKCEQFLLKQGFKKIEALENPQTKPGR